MASKLFQIFNKALGLMAIAAEGINLSVAKANQCKENNGQCLVHGQIVGWSCKSECLHTASKVMADQRIASITLLPEEESKNYGRTFLSYGYLSVNNGLQVMTISDSPR